MHRLGVARRTVPRLAARPVPARTAVPALRVTARTVPALGVALRVTAGTETPLLV